MDNYEPVVQVETKDSALTTYGPVDTKAIARILEEHVIGGNIVEEYLIGK
jgi:(2Fe-2S) ferredoxin